MKKKYIKPEIKKLPLKMECSIAYYISGAGFDDNPADENQDYD